jgi:hypothetical protein
MIGRAVLLSTFIALGFGASDSRAQTAPLPSETAVEMMFWESVRASSDPADFRAYLEKYPNGTFAPLARNRLAALGEPQAGARPSPQPSAPPVQARTAGRRLPSEGDTWTYRLSEPKRVDGPKERNYIVKIFAASASAISEEYAIEGEGAGQWTHKGVPDLVPVGRPVLAPYLLAFGDLPPGGALGRVQVAEGACGTTYQCQASGRIVSWETIKVPAGTFDTVRVEVDHSWRSVAMSGAQGAQAYGSRKLTVWYSAAAKRAVKFSSRATMGHFAPIETDFELELSSYQLK